MSTRSVNPSRTSPQRPSLRTLVSTVLGAAALAAPVVGWSFKIGTPGEPAVHETLTANAIAMIAPSANPIFVANVQSGVYNTDFAHQGDHSFHFDASDAFNGGFINGFNTIGTMLGLAQGEQQICNPNTGACAPNPYFLSPLHASFASMAQDLADAYLALAYNTTCLAELACPTTDLTAKAAAVEGMLAAINIDTDPDPDPPLITGTGTVPSYADLLGGAKGDLDNALGRHCRPWPLDGTCFNTLEDMSNDNDFQLSVGALRVLQYEYQAYYAWQHLGHAFHTTQDFFAHSNYVELVSCQKGPPCKAGAKNADLVCGTALNASVVPFGSVPLPTDAHLPTSIGDFINEWSWLSVQVTLNNRPAVFSDANANHLITGYFPCLTASDPPNPYLACHDDTMVIGGANPPLPTMYKDKSFAPGADPSLQNFDWASLSAERVSIALASAFLMDAFVSAPNLTPAVAANKILPTEPPISCGAPVAIATGPAPVTAIGVPTTATAVNPPKVVTTPPTTTPTPVTKQPSLVAPVKVRGLAAAPSPVAAAAAAPSPISRFLPPIRHPELVPRETRPHIFVRVIPRRAVQPGETITVRVDAFDAQNGAPLPGLPVTLGNIRATTMTPFNVAVPAPHAQRCGTHGGSAFCVDAAVPMTGVVIPPAGYTGGGGAFAITVAAPKIVAFIAGKTPVVNAGANTLVVSAVDQRTGQAVPNAVVLLNGQAVGPANQPITINLPAPPALVLPGPTGGQRQPYGMGPAMVARAPGYPDALVRYAINTP